MGDIKKLRKKYTPPRHPWQGPRINAEKVLVKEYGLKNKREIYKTQSLLRNFSKQAKNLIAYKTEQSEKEKKQLFDKLANIGLLHKDADLEQVLGLTIDKLLERRLQTLVYKKGLSRSVVQARQFITHGHIAIKGQKVNIPGYLVKAEEETHVEFVKNSNLSSAEHPERVVKEKNVLKKEVNENIENDK